VYLPQAPFIRALVYTGGRFGEMAQTTWSDWDRKSRSITFRAATTKSKKVRRVPLIGVVEADLNHLFALHAQGYGRDPQPGDRIFLSPAGHEVLDGRENALRFLHDALDRAGIEKVDLQQGRITLHSLRHTFASLMARAGAGLTQTQVLMGHSTPELTAVRYTHHEAADLRAAVEKIKIA
jgi:integrase